MVRSLKNYSKSVLADSLMDLAKSKPLEKITVQNIVNHCGAGRQTFYNHFRDKYDLMNWIYKTNARKIWRASSATEPWEKILSKIMEHMVENKTFYFRAINTSGQNSFYQSLFQDSQYSCKVLVQKILKNNDLPENILFSIDFYCYGAVNMVKQWAENGMNEPPEKVAANIFRSMPEDLKVIIINGEK